MPPLNTSKIAAACLAVGLAICASTLTASPGLGQVPEAVRAAACAGKEWIAKAADNICGLRDLGQLSNPAQVDFGALMSATPEMHTLKDQKIEPTSPEGIKLTNAAADRVTKACEDVRAREGYCSVWKEIRHRDGRSVTDITEKVKAQF